MTSTSTNTVPTNSGVITTNANTTVHLQIENYVQGEMKWDRWMQRLKIGFSYHSIPEEKKVTCLLFHLGVKAFDSVCDYLNGTEPHTLEYNTLKTKLKDLFAPKAIAIAENFKFYNRKQQTDEDISAFTNALNNLSLQCNFGDYKDKALLNQFVVGLKDVRLQRRLLEKADLTYEKAIQMAAAMELTNKEATAILQNQNATIHALHADRKNFPKSHKNQNKSYKHSSVNHGKQNTPDSQNKNNHASSGSLQCYRCGGAGHTANRCRVNAKQLFCEKCARRGHVASVCFGARTNTNCIDDYDSIDEVFDTYMIDEVDQLEQINSRQKFLKRLQVNNIGVLFEIDSGAAVSLMWVEDARRFFKGIRIHNTQTRLISFCKTQINVVGYITVKVHYANSILDLNLYLTSIQRSPIAGREWLREMLRIGGASQLFDDISQISSIESETDRKLKIEKLLSTYNNCTKMDLSKITGITASLTLKENTRPVFLKARPVPFKLIPLISNEIDRLVSEGVLVKVNSSDYATPVVPVLKKNNTVRLCGDYSVTLNPNLIVDEHPLPTTDEMFASLADCKHFCKIDLRQAYLQMEVDEASSKLLTINTHKGLYRPTRLMYGVASACAIWQREMENILNGIQGVFVLLDDIRIAGKTEEELLNRLELVLKKLHDHNIKINHDKCEFFKDEIEFCGYVIDKYGLHKSKTKIDAIERMPRPQNESEVRSFIGFVTYYNHFIANVSQILRPLNKLLRKDAKFFWSEECQQAFLRAKEEFTSDTCLTFYNPKLPLLLATDASPTGVGAVLSHKFPDGTEKPIMYISQSFNSTQAKYSQIDKEAYAIVFAVKKLHKYLYGNKFTLITDHRPLTQIFSQTNSLPTYSALRMQHYAIFLRAYNYDIVYKRSENNSNADGLSRLPIPSVSNNIDVIDIFYVETIETMPISVELLHTETEKDDDIMKVIKALRLGKKLTAKETWNIDPREFSLEQQALVRGQRIVIPKTLRNKVLQELHVGHFGIVRMKALARGHCWWPNINSEIEDLIRNCSNCQVNQHRPPKVEKHIWETPTKPFERVHIDFAGAFRNRYFFLLVDAFTKWPEVCITKGMTSVETILVCKRIFSTYGIPNVLVSDNFSAFKSEEFTDFTRKLGITQKFIAPYFPATNGQVERYVQIIKDSLNKMDNSKNCESDLQDILLQYRITPHSVTGFSPSELMFGRNIQSKLDFMKSRLQKPKSPIYNENKKIREFKYNQRVEAKNYSGNKLWVFGRITERTGRLHYKITLDDGRVCFRHADQIRNIGENIPSSTPTNIDDYHVPLSEQIKIFPSASEQVTESTNTSPISSSSLNSSFSSANSSIATPPRGRGRGRGRGMNITPETEDIRNQTPGRPRRETRLPAHLRDYVLK